MRLPCVIGNIYIYYYIIMKTVKVAGIEVPVTDLTELSKTWDVSDEKREQVLKQAEWLVPKMENFVTDEKNDQELARKVALSAKLNEQIILKWPKGTGKTTTIYFVASETNNPLVPIQLNWATQVDTLVGKWLVNKEGTYWVDGLLTLAFRYGWWIILDEVNMALPEVMAVLHPATDSRGILVLEEKDGEIVKRHPNTRIFGAMNPTEDYAGTKEMNAAFEDRFSGFAICGYPNPKKERDIILANRKVKIDDEPLKAYRAKEGTVTLMVKAAQDIRKLRDEQKIVFELSTRNLIDWACWCSEIPIKEAFKFAVISKNEDAEEAKTIMDVVDKYFTNDQVWSEANKTKSKSSSKTSDSEAEIDIEDDIVGDF